MTWAGFATHAVTIEDEGSSLRWHAADEGGMRGFCGRCGGPMFFKSECWPGELHIARALFIEPIDRAPQAHVFYDTHVDWVTVGDDLPRKSNALAASAHGARFQGTATITDARTRRAGR